MRRGLQVGFHCIRKSLVLKNTELFITQKNNNRRLNLETSKKLKKIDLHVTFMLISITCF